MCGIAGFVSFGCHERAAARARVQQMTDAIIYRGPDEGGVYVDEFAALGHRRLSIIDLSGGQQPMSALDGRVHIVFNGEIYNFMEIRAQLEALGHEFRTHSDTEVILRSYIAWGEGCLEKLNGMFAFAIWDARSQSVVLARDRVGKKPLYYHWHKGVLAFASELKALRAAGLCPDNVDPEALDCYFAFGYIPAPRTIYRNVRKLRAAHVLIATRAGISERKYWKLSPAEKKSRPIEEVVNELECLLDDAVAIRLMSDVPLGAFLSGGLDSSLVVAAMTRAMRGARPVITNSIGFEEREFSEAGVAKAIAQHLSTDHHEFTVKPDAVGVLPKIARHFDEPLADSSAVPTWYVCEMARRTVTVALSGDGGDESFGGYTFRYVPHIFESRIRRAIPTAIRGALFGALGSAWPDSARLPRPLRLKTILENLAVSDAEAFYRDLVWLRPAAREVLYTEDFRRTLMGFTPYEVVEPYYSDNDARDALGRAQFTDIHFYMTDDVLVKVDRMSMAHSLEVRSPLLDYRLLEFAATLPAEQKIVGREGKLPLRMLAERRLPAEVRRLPKRGFSIPAAEWLRKDLRSFAEAHVFGRDAFFREMLDMNVIEQMWRDHMARRRDHSVFLWGLMMLNLWADANPTRSSAVDKIPSVRSTAVEC